MFRERERKKKIIIIIITFYFNHNTVTYFIFSFIKSTFVSKNKNNKIIQLYTIHTNKQVTELQEIEQLLSNYSQNPLLLLFTCDDDN